MRSLDCNRRIILPRLLTKDGDQPSCQQTMQTQHEKPKGLKLRAFTHNTYYVRTAPHLDKTRLREAQEGSTTTKAASPQSAAQSSSR